MRQLEEQIRNLVEESVMRKRRRLDPQAVVFPAATNTPGKNLKKMTSVIVKIFEEVTAIYLHF